MTDHQEKEDKAETESVTSSILFETPDKDIVIIDIPSSLQECQVLPSQIPHHRIISAEPPATPYRTPEPRDGGPSNASPAAQLAELMTAATVSSALEILADTYPGPFHRPRLLAPSIPVSSPLMPDSAEYLDGSIQDLCHVFDASAPTFDLVVLDPPWPNRSVRRKTDKYSTVSSLTEMRQLLLQIPLSSHLSQDGLVAVWITNKHAIQDFLTSPTGLFAAWGLEVATEWTWLKVATSGEPLFDIDSTWRKPWEKLIIAKRKGIKTPAALRSKVVIAVPDVHSRKPNLRPLFQDILDQGFLGLEIFARNVTAGWWSWGDQVLDFQQPQHWTIVESQEK